MKGIENPILTDIEELAKNIFDRCRLREPTDQMLINFVCGLVCKESLKELIKYNNRSDYDKRMVFLRRKYHCQPKKIDLNQYYQLLLGKGQIQKNATLEPFLRLKSTRSHSGVLVITVLTSPGKFSCPKDCYFCPDERDPNGKMIMPRSYLSSEPACRRAKQNQFDPVLQFFDRAEVLRKIGHTVDKIEILVLGGTW